MEKADQTVGVVFDIQRFCIHDGPGIRTTVFFKGCPLQCAWCHNAEGLSAKVGIYYNKEKCIGCARCVAACPAGAHTVSAEGHRFDFSLCRNCFACTESCPTGALRPTGREMYAREVVAEVCRDKAFFQSSGGGVTLSGGEPLLQGAFAVEIARLFKEEGIHVCVETSGFASKETVSAIAPFVDIFLFDYKHSDSALHEQYTGVPQDVILENLRLLSDLEKNIVLRCPIIPDCNDTREHYKAIAALANEIRSVTAVRVEPYHPFGLKKYEAVGLSPSYAREKMMEEEAAQRARDMIASLTEKEVV